MLAPYCCCCCCCCRMKQEAKERSRALKIQQRLEDVKQQERAKVKEGKKIFHLKRSAQKEIALEERFNELKKEGKLKRFMERKRRKNANKDHRWMPSKRLSLNTDSNTT